MSALSSLEIAGFQPDDAFRRGVALLRTANLCGGVPYRPPTAAENTEVHQSKRAKMQQCTLGWHGGDPMAFVESAKKLAHPARFETLHLPPDLLRVVEIMSTKRGATPAWRRKRLSLLHDVASSLLPLNQQVLAEMSDCVRHVCGEYNVAFFACVIDATDFPDKNLPRRLVRGFQVYGKLEYTGLWADGGDPPAVPNPDFSSSSNINWNARLLQSVQERGEAASQQRAGDAWKAIEAIWAASTLECSEGWTVGYDTCSSQPHERRWRGLTSQEVDRHPWLKGRGRWRALRRFGVFQNDKWRPVDDATENQVNPATGARDKLALIGADTPAHLAQAFDQGRLARVHSLGKAGRVSEAVALESTPDAFEQGTEDVKKAFRRIPSNEPGYMVVCLFNPFSLRAEFMFLPSFVFGPLSAVHAWNRLSSCYTHVARRLLGVPALGYFDDYPTGAPAYDQGSAQACFSSFVDMLGPGFAPAKHEPPDQVAVSLGVQSDYSHLPNTGTILVSVTESRRRKLVLLISQVLSSGHLSHAAARSLFGKSRYTCCPCFGRVGIAILHPLQDAGRRSTIVRGSPLWSALVALREIIAVLPPVPVPISPVRYDLPLLVWTDASSPSTLHGRLGVVIYCPYRNRYWYTSIAAPRHLMCLFSYLEKKQTYICQLELLAVVTALLTFPDLFAGRLVHIFVDNEAAKSNLISGYSPHADSARVIHEYHVQVARLACYPWLSFVYSQDNIADLPSRASFLSVAQQARS